MSHREDPTTIGIGLASDAILFDGITERRRERGRTMLDTPQRRDFWFGHGYVVDEPPERRSLDALIAEGHAEFGPAGADRFVVMWERSIDSQAPFDVWPSGVEIDRDVVQTYVGETPLPDPRVIDVGGALGWAGVCALAVTEYPHLASFTARRFDDFRTATAEGRARTVAIVDEHGAPACTATLYRGERLARFAVPVTRPDARGRGLFSACARTLVDWGRADAERDVVILADYDNGPVALYESLGFRPVAFVEAAIVTLRAG